MSREAPQTSRRPVLQASDVETVRFQLPTASGLLIAVAIDRPLDREICGRVLLVPAFGLSMRDMLAASFHFLCNGFEVVRFDPTSHVGESGGAMRDFTLGGLTADLETVIASPMAADALVVGFSLSARAALRAAVNMGPAALLLAIPVVHVRRTLQAVTGEDWIGRFLADPGSIPESGDVLGLQIRSIGLGECVTAGLHDLEGTLRDARRVDAPTVLVAGARDAWVDAADVERVHGALPHSQLHFVRGAGHEMFRSPIAAAAVLRVLIDQAMACRSLRRTTLMPPFRDLIQFTQEYGH